MGKVYIGVMAVGGHKLWGGGGWKEGCGIRWFWGMGERWKIDGRRRGGCGPGMPGPYRGRKGERVLAGRCAGVGWFRAIFVGGRRPRHVAEGSRPLPTMWGETGCVKQ